MKYSKYKLKLIPLQICFAFENRRKGVVGKSIGVGIENEIYLSAERGRFCDCNVGVKEKCLLESLAVCIPYK